jgi:FkbM family methyltransferase
MIASSIKKSIKAFLFDRGYQLSWTAAGSVNGSDLARDLGVILAGHHPLCFDVGANKGQTIQLLRSCLRQPVIHAFEPTPELSDALQRQHFCSGVSIHSMALGSSRSTMRLRTYAMNELNSLLTLTPGESNPFGQVAATGEVEVKVTTIDEFCAEHNLEKIDLLKIDTQGFDLEVIKGADRTIGAGRVRHVLVELNFIDLYVRQCSPWEVQNVLSEAGFRLVDYYEKNREGAALGWCTALFRHTCADT